MTTAAPGGGPIYRVTGISAGQWETDGAGNPVKGHIVAYRLGDGTSDQVFIPDAQWNVDQAQTLIEEAVKLTAGIRGLARE